MSFIGHPRWSFYVDFPNDRQRLIEGRRVLLNRLDGVISRDGHARIWFAPTVDPDVVSLMVDFDATVPQEEVTAAFRAAANLVGRPGSLFAPPQWENSPTTRPVPATQARYSA